MLILQNVASRNLIGNLSMLPAFGFNHTCPPVLAYRSHEVSFQFGPPDALAFQLPRLVFAIEGPVEERVGVHPGD